MKDLTYVIQINASKEDVWSNMLDPIRYRDWARAFSPDSQYAGEWTQGSYMTFFDPHMGGTKALLEEVIPLERIRARHVAILKKDGTEDASSDDAKKWIGMTETYVFQETGGTTMLTIEMRTHADYVSMFDEAWPEALRLIKAMCE